MPTYSYRCTECGNAFDIVQSFTDDSLTECPVCSGVLRKVFSPVGVTFNGSGFYRTDSRSSADKKSGSSSSSSSEKSSGSSGSSEKSSSPAPSTSTSTGGASSSGSSGTSSSGSGSSSGGSGSAS
ncbi:putative FmdB family regulatory protein [Frigoribacterium sp. PhB160]|uniref:FmdB family zinc ribbon protein n=1 Tax=Frigoribacterium sp. PhB160 TaxID=2485192 RepID=UPI000F491B8A|nr:FmdB family zinc ribbon protein [Frigoribacterium sp. PhB160]ROS59293.1 putative FmdB family regulatory protein [Frigoribacterium sp. PhB160]